ncbi:hypothetical protein MKX54_11105 [Alkalihalobacillus sp. FSL R5-0424]
MRNKLTDLNNHLFEQLERLNDEELKGEQLQEEIGRASAVSKISNQIITSAAISLKAKKLMDNRLDPNTTLPEVLDS